MGVEREMGAHNPSESAAENNPPRWVPLGAVLLTGCGGVRGARKCCCLVASFPSFLDRYAYVTNNGNASPDEQFASVRSMAYRDINALIRAFFNQNGFSSCASQPTRRESMCCGNIACKAVITDSIGLV